MPYCPRVLITCPDHESWSRALLISCLDHVPWWSRVLITCPDPVPWSRVLIMHVPCWSRVLITYSYHVSWSRVSWSRTLIPYSDHVPWSRAMIIIPDHVLCSDRVPWSRVSWSRTLITCPWRSRAPIYEIILSSGLFLDGVYNYKLLGVNLQLSSWILLLLFHICFFTNANRLYMWCLYTRINNDSK